MTFAGCRTEALCSGLEGLQGRLVEMDSETLVMGKRASSVGLLGGSD
jgi:hypothetical protein